MALFRGKNEVLPASISHQTWLSTDWISSSVAPLNLVVGEQHNQTALAAASEARGQDDRSRGDLLPALVEFSREADNPYDSNAWTAKVDGRKVGHLRKTSAAVATRIGDSQGMTSFTVVGLIRGGREGSSFGVHVWPNANLTPAPALPNDPESTPVPWPPGDLETATDSEKDDAGCPMCGKWAPLSARYGDEITCERCQTVFVLQSPA